MGDPEKQAGSTGHQGSPGNASSHDTLTTNAGQSEVEKHDRFLTHDAPPLGSQLTPTESRKSRVGSYVSRSRSYVDGYSGHYNTEEGLEKPEARDNDAGTKEFTEVKWDGENDPMNPRNMKTWRKWIVVFTLAFGSLCVTCVSSLYTTTYDQIDVEFHVSTLVSTLGLATFVWGLGLAPMVLGPLSEFYGRRPVYIGAYFFFTVWLVPCGKSTLIPFFDKISPLIRYVN